MPEFLLLTRQKLSWKSKTWIVFQGVAGKITWLKGSEKKGFRELGETDFDGEYEP